MEMLTNSKARNQTARHPVIFFFPWERALIFHVWSHFFLSTESAHSRENTRFPFPRSGAGRCFIRHAAAIGLTRCEGCASAYQPRLLKHPHGTWLKGLGLWNGTGLKKKKKENRKPATNPPLNNGPRDPDVCMRNHSEEEDKADVFVLNMEDAICFLRVRVRCPQQKHTHQSLKCFPVWPAHRINSGCFLRACPHMTMSCWWLWFCWGGRIQIHQALH